MSEVITERMRKRVGTGFCGYLRYYTSMGCCLRKGDRMRVQSLRKVELYRRGVRKMQDEAEIVRLLEEVGRAKMIGQSQMDKW